MAKYILFLIFFLSLDSCFCAISSPSARRSVRNRKLRQLSNGITRCNNHNINNEVNKQLLEKHLQQSEFVFTGKVTSEFDLQRDSTNVNAIYGNNKIKGEYRGFLIKVKRVLKGDMYKRDKVTHVQLLVGKSGETEGDKYSHVCYSIIRIHHTAIFLAKRSSYVDNTTTSISLESTADPLPITLRNLDQVNAYVKDMTYKPRPPLLEEPCEKKYCPWGSLCVVDTEDAAHCECANDCISDTAGPVCGTDDVTYESQCLVRRKACLQQDNTRIRHSGQCGEPPKRRRP